MEVQFPIVIAAFLMINVVAFGILEVYLARHKNKWVGLIIPIVSLVLLVPLTANFIDAFSPIPVWENSYGDETQDDVKIYFGVVNDPSGKVAAFSDLQVKDRATGEKTWYAMEFDNRGNLIGGKEALKYKESIEDLSHTDGYFTGKSSSPKSMKWQYVKNNVDDYGDRAILMFLNVAVTAYYLIIYKVMRKRLHKKEAARAEDKRSRLQEL